MNPAVPIAKLTSRAMSLGASLVGAAPVAALLDSPTHRLYPVDRRIREAGAVVVLALNHTPNRPEMDWWDQRKGRTTGNRLLININRKLSEWIKTTYAVNACELPYDALRKGIFLKDAAVLAGLGVLGKNNLLITPQYGPRVRLRALLLEAPLQSTGPLDGFAPCEGCDGPCVQACPRQAFQGGFYQRQRCLQQMKKDEADTFIWPTPVGRTARFRIAYCRRCELSCPVGR
ncbi:MAG: hypothetical protein PVJ53_12945 [Desulfobacterales bacterium]